MIHRTLTISGVVQGVGFRAWVLRLACKIGVNGWVKNNTDGTVSVCAEGEELVVDDFITAVRIGPAGATVESSTVDDGAIEGYTEFRLVL